ncbi:MAG: hypothetical protein QNJ40_04735 [Xanthomonadales bacterium]|nr:hypothetical protein [Xanthomonadales bacterium]
MTLCPGALTLGCKKCPIFKVCPLKGVIGDQKPEPSSSEPRAESKDD